MSQSISTTEQEKETGTVKWFNGEKRFGFILRDCGGEIFVHVNRVSKDARPLNQGDRVRYVADQGQHGMIARQVTKV